MTNSNNFEPIKKTKTKSNELAQDRKISKKALKLERQLARQNKRFTLESEGV